MEVDAAVALELERLRGTVGTGLAEIKGQLDVIKANGDRTEKDIGDLSGRVKAVEAQVSTLAAKTRVEKLELRVGAVEKRIVFAFGASSALGGAVGLAATYLGH